MPVVGGLAYATLSFLVNRTRFTLAEGTLTVRHRPLPWPGRAVSVQDVVALEIVSRTGWESDAVSWVLQALGRDGPPVVLLGPPQAPIRYSTVARAAQDLARLLQVPVR